LYESAQLIINLRKSIKSGDWMSLRFWIANISDEVHIASESDDELHAIKSISSNNLNFHSMSLKGNLYLCLLIFNVCLTIYLTINLTINLSNSLSI
jgi:hypothetical protein